MTRRIVVLLLTMLLAISLLTSVPALRPVVRTIGHIKPVWILAAIALELGSCVSFVFLFRLFFDRLSPPDGRALAWTEQASGALLPGGGAGGLAIGGWLMHLKGASTEWIVRRSGGLFFLTSAVNSVAVIIAGLLLTLHVGSPHGFTLALLPAAIAMAATLPVAALPRLLRAHPGAPHWLQVIATGVQDAEQTTFHRPNWRVAGSLGYLYCDMAVLWVTLHAVGEPISVPALILAYNIGYLANTLPIPGGIGVVDAGLAGTLLLYGVSPLHVTAGVLVYHAISLWIPGLGGTLAYLRLRSRLSPDAAASTSTFAEDPPTESDHHAPPSARPPADSPRLGRLPHWRKRARSLPRTVRPYPSGPLPRPPGPDGR